MGPREALFLPLTEYYMGPRDCLVRQTSCSWSANASQSFKYYIHVVGPCEGLHLLLIGVYAGPRDTFVRRSAMSLMGQYEPIVQMLRTCGGPTRWPVPPANRILCGPTQLSRMAVRHVLDGPMRTNFSNATCMQRAHAKACPWFLAGFCGPTRVSWQRLIIRIAGQYYVGPRGSPVRQPAMLFMGQCNQMF
jgi:hypothetical protein